METERYRSVLSLLVLVSLLSVLALSPATATAASDRYAGILQQLDVDSGAVTLPGADAKGFDPPHRWDVTVNDPGKVCLEEIRRRYEDLIRLRYVDWSDPSVQEKVARLNQDLAWRIAQQDPQTGAIAGGLGTIYAMAIAYHTPGSPYYHDRSLITDHIEPAILYERDYGNLYPENGFPGNWWSWEVSVPFRIVDILFAVGDQLSIEPRNALEDMLIWTNQWSGRNASSAPPYNKYSPSGDLFSLQEANGAWFRTVALLTGLYFRLPPVVQWAVDEIGRTASINMNLGEAGLPSYGVKPDETFWDHGRGPNQLYGDHLFETLSFVAYLVQGSECYSLSPGVGDYLDEYFHGWLRWNTFHGLEAPVTRGRWPHLVEHGELFMGVLFRLNTLGVGYRDELVRVAADWLEEHPGDLNMRQGYWGFASPWFGNFHLPGDTLIAQPLLDNAEALLPQAADPPQGARYYPYSELLLVRRPGWFATLGMRSVLNPMGNANRAHDANLTILTDENYTDYTDMDYVATQLYGAVTAVEGDPYNYWQRDQSPMAGGVALGDYAAAGMALRVMESDSTWTNAHASCFFFDNEIACVGSDIRSDDARQARTYINTFRDETHTVRSGSGWLHEGTIGVVLPDRPPWDSEVLTFSKDPPWRRLYIPHGVRPQGAAYTLIYLPRASVAETQAYAAAPDARVLVRTPAVHVVQDGSSGLTGVVFFEAVQNAAGHASSGPGHLLYQVAGGRVASLAFYNPTGEVTTFDLSVPVPASAWLASQIQADAVVSSSTFRSDGFDIRFTLPAFGTLSWYQTTPNLSTSAKRVSRVAVYQGDRVTYTLAIRNTGGPLTTPITVTDSFPDGMVSAGGLCASSWGDPPICTSSHLTWSGVLSTTAEVVISYSVEVTTDQRRVLLNQMKVDAGPYGTYASTATVIANPLFVHLPLVARGATR